MWCILCTYDGVMLFYDTQPQAGRDTGAPLTFDLVAKPLGKVISPSSSLQST